MDSIKFLMPLFRVLPQNVQDYIKLIHNFYFGEPEIRLLPYLCNKNKISLDIGASNGKYFYWLIKYSKFCVAFEPHPEMIKILFKKFSKNKNVKIISNAVSNVGGFTDLRIPLNEGSEETGLSTIHSENKLINFHIKQVTVKTIKLDDLNCSNIGFIKIDVEGHELEVLNGGKNLIIENHPKMLIEIENRLNPNALLTVFKFMKMHEYSGYFLMNRKIFPIEKFKPEEYQNIKNLNKFGTEKLKGKTYINNFIFIHNSDPNRHRFGSRLET